MNGTRIRAAVAITCIAALAAPGSALAAKKKKRAKPAQQQVTIVLKRDFDAGGNGAGLRIPTPGVRVDLGIDLVGLTAAIPNELLVSLGLPPTPAGELPTIPPLPLY